MIWAGLMLVFAGRESKRPTSIVWPLKAWSSAVLCGADLFANRAALMTGRDPIRLGVAYSVILPGQWGFIPANISCHNPSEPRAIRQQ